MLQVNKSKLEVLRVDHVGSLLRPARLIDVFLRHGKGEASDEELRQAQDEAIRQVISAQEAHHLPIAIGDAGPLLLGAVITGQRRH